VSAPAAVPAAETADAAVLADRERLGHRIKGPSALGSDPRRLWHLTWTLAKTEFKLAFFGSVLGYLWQLMRPLLLFGVIYLVFTYAYKSKLSSLPNYPAALLLGIVLFTFYSEATGGAVASLVNRENLVRKIEFPRLAVPLATTLTGLFNLTLNLITVTVFLFAAGGHALVTWLEVPLLLAAFAVFASGLGMILSVGYVRYRDVRPIWEVLLQMSFYASGIFFYIPDIRPATILGVRVNLSHVLMTNPFAAVLEQARHMFVSPVYPSAATVLGGTTMLLIPVGVALATVALGFLFFDHEAPRVAEQL
jgi:ABC-2 type transport system permease protein